MDCKIAKVSSLKPQPDSRRAASVRSSQKISLAPSRCSQGDNVVFAVEEQKPKVEKNPLA